MTKIKEKIHFLFAFKYIFYSLLPSVIESEAEKQFRFVPICDVYSEV